MAETSRTDILDAVYASTDRGSLDRAYDDWAERYDRDVMAMGYQIPAVLTGLVARHLAKGAGPVLDVGAGTGLIGLALAALGHDRVDALDMNAAMLAKARERGVYRATHQRVLGEPLGLAPGSYAAIVASGVFTRGHAPASALADLADLLGPAALFVMSERVDDGSSDAYVAARRTLVDAGTWVEIDRSGDFQPFPLEPAEVHVRSRVVVLRRR